MNEAARTILQAEAAAAPEPERQTDPGFLWDFWYPVAGSTEIRGQKLAKALLLEVPLVLDALRGRN